MNQIVEWQFVRNRLASKTGKIFALRETFQLSTFNGGSSNQNNNNNNTNTNNDDDGKPIWFASPTILVCLVRARIIASRQAIITSRIVKRKRVRFGSNQSVHSSEINFLSLSLSLSVSRFQHYFSSLLVVVLFFVVGVVCARWMRQTAKLTQFNFNFPAIAIDGWMDRWRMNMRTGIKRDLARQETCENLPTWRLKDLSLSLASSTSTSYSSSSSDPACLPLHIKLSPNSPLLFSIEAPLSYSSEDEDEDSDQTNCAPLFFIQQ